ncbi:MAG: DNA-directed RNA polymerase subunit A'' [Candidatus Aenigmatarchaeota archaeon]
MSEKLHKDYLTELPKSIVDQIDQVSSKMKLSEKQKEQLVKEVIKEYYKSAFEPGEAIGIISAQSISEPATQMTMRTYHFAASAGIQVTLGLPRLIEIFDARKEPTTPMMTIYLKSKYNTKEKAEEIAKNIKEKKVKYFAKSISIDLTNKKIKIEMDKVKKSEMNEIMEKLTKQLKDFKVKELTSSISIEANPNMSIKDLEKWKRKILSMYVSGVQNVKNTVVLKEGDNWVIKTLGSNLEKIFQMEEVDTSRSYSNNIHEIASILGIEAARTILIKEILDTLKQQGLNVDERHITLVADIMTLTGEIRAVGRYGVAGTQSSVLARAGFEETIKHLVKASVRNEVDDFEGIFDNVMINQQVPIGTGMFELISKLGEE